MKLENHSIIFPTIEHRDTICGAPVELGRLLAKTNEVIILEVETHFPLRKLTSFLSQYHSLPTYFTPLGLLPFKRYSVVRHLNTSLNLMVLIAYLRLVRKKTVILWFLFPHCAYLALLKPFVFGVFYEILDYHTSLDSGKKKRIQNQQKLLLKKADFTYAISRSLSKKFTEMANKRITIPVVPAGFKLDLFINHKDTPSMPSKPIIGYVGGISHRLDIDLLYRVIDNCPAYTFTFAGPLEDDGNVANLFNQTWFDDLFSRKNVTWIGTVSANDVPDLIRSFSIGIIPYKSDLEFNQFSYPIKLFEYFYQQKPVLTTPLLEFTSSQFDNLLNIANTVEEWLCQLDLMLSKPMQSFMNRRRREFAVSNSWEQKELAIRELVEKLV